MSRIVKFDSDVREKILEGVNTLAEAVATTLGPKGRNVAIKMSGNYYQIYHDGVTVAKSINLSDELADVGVQQLKEAATKTNEKGGDGTTTATILAQAIVTEGIKNVQAGMNPQTLKSGIEKATVLVLEELKKLSKEVTTEEEIQQVATISAADPILGRLVSDALKKVGKKGVVTVEDGNSLETVIDHKQGMEIDRGYLSPYFINNQERVEAILENPFILLTDKRLGRGYDIVPFLEKFVQSGNKNLVIFAGDLNDEAMATIVVNHLRGSINCIAIQAPAFGGRRIDELEDIAILTGGTAILEDSGRTLDSVTIEELGRADKIISDRDKSIIINGKGDKKVLEKRINELEDQIKIANTDFDKEIKIQRMAKLANGVAVIYVGYATETELREKKERVIDAVNSTKAAAEEGIIPGGGVSLLLASLILENLVLPGEEGIGVSIVKQALKKPFLRLLDNAGMNSQALLGKVLESPAGYGIDVMTGQLVNLIEAGIIDPVKVTRAALENAVSVAAMLITTNVMVVDEKENK